MSCSAAKAATSCPVAPGDDEIEGEEAADTLEGGGGSDQFNFFTSAFQPDSTFAARDVVLDFQRRRASPAAT